MTHPFDKLQAQTLKAIDEANCKNTEIGMLWADRYGGKAHNSGQRVKQVQLSGLPLSVLFWVELLDILGYRLTITKKKD